MNPIALVLGAAAIVAVLWELTQTRRVFTQNKRRQEKDAADHLHRYGY